MRWPIVGFGPRKSITPKQAQFLHSETVDYIQKQLKMVELLESL
jgi:hypothetical protein